jgi:hypothetical protein
MTEAQQKIEEMVFQLLPCWTGRTGEGGFSGAVDEAQSAVELAEPTIVRRGQAEKSGLEKKPSHRRAHTCHSRARCEHLRPPGQQVAPALFPVR